MKRNQLIVLSLLVIGIWSCGNDDDGLLDAESVPPRSLTEVEIENDAEIITFLQSHFYNYEEFENPLADFDFEIIVDSISGDNAGKIPLIEQVQSATVTISSSDFFLDSDETDIVHTYYFLVAREGVGESPTFADSTFVNFKGTLLDGTIFDAVQSEGTWFDIPSFNFAGDGSLRAFRGVGEVLSNFRPGGEIIDNPDGTFEVEDHGVGMVIFPSGLGSFNGFRGEIPQYSPLIFFIDMFVTEEADHDNDGIPSFLEDIDGDGNVVNDREDENGFPNYLNPDDDGDGTLTIDEDLEPDTDLTVDRDQDGDPTNDIGDGNPLNDDTDGDGIPNYLDPDDDASRNDNDN